MSAHTCRVFTPGCYRCDLGRDEEISALAEDYFEVMAEPSLRRCEVPAEAINRMRLRYLGFAVGNEVIAAHLYVWHARREAADVDSMADHAWNVRDVFASNA